jgi:hypothetical protein
MARPIARIRSDLSHQMILLAASIEQCFHKRNDMG